MSRARRVRRPVVAGVFYPAGSAVLRSTVDALLEGAFADPTRSPSPSGLVAPHAGYVYSGQVAAAAFVRAGHERRVVLLGPSHYVPLDGMAVSGAEAWESPLGRTPVTSDLRERALAAGAVVDEAPHERDHALEVQLPFLQRRFPDGLEILPVAVGRTTIGQVAALLDGLDALVVVSTDLSHYESESRAHVLDRGTADSVLAGDASAIADDAACGVFALRGLVEHARLRRLDTELLELRTSADVTGDHGRVVGYGAFAFSRSA